MRPRLIAVDDFVPRHHHRRLLRASMRPRLIAVDDTFPVDGVPLGRYRFNEATADRRG